MQKKYYIFSCTSSGANTLKTSHSDRAEVSNNFINGSLSSFIMRNIFSDVLGKNSFIVSFLSVLTTYLSYKYDLLFNFPLTIIGIAVVFPIVFSINSAYKRREIALGHYASFKTFGRGLYFATRDWAGKGTSHETIKKLLKDTLIEAKKLFQGKGVEKKIYDNFSTMSKEIEKLRKRIPSGEMSRCNQYFSKLMNSFENLKHIATYRTPIQLRTYSKGFSYIIPIIYGPYFAFIAKDFEFGILTFVMPFLFSIVLVSLVNIQEHLENPFDEVGDDDLRIDVDKFIGTM